MCNLKNLQGLLDDVNADYFLTLTSQLSAKYFFARYLRSDVYSIVFSRNGEIFINPKRELLKKKRVAVYFNDLKYKEIISLRKRYKLIDISKSIDEMRIVKSRTEIEKIKKACEITKKVIEDIRYEMKKARSEKDVASDIIKRFLDNYADVAFEPIVAFNHNTSYIHHIPTHYNPPNKDIVLIDIGAKWSYYNADMSRTFVYNPKYFKAYEDVKHTLSVLEDAIHEGVSVKDIVNLAKDLLKSYGKCSFSYHHLLGHGIGLEVHELPNFKDDIHLKKNMVFTLEPAIYVKNKFGVRIENMYIVKKKKVKSLC